MITKLYNVVLELSLEISPGFFLNYNTHNRKQNIHRILGQNKIAAVKFDLKKDGKQDKQHRL